MQPSSPAIVFDLGNVLIQWDPRHLYRRLFAGDEEGLEYFLTTVCPPHWNHELDGGRSFQEAIAERVALFPHYEAHIRAFHSHWEEMVPGAIEGSVQLLAELRAAGYYLAALSNWSAETFPRVRPRFPFLTWFETIVLSGEEGVTKPDPALYRVLLERIKRPASDCLFIDDTRANVDTALRLGFDAIHFESPAQLRQELGQRGLIGR